MTVSNQDVKKKSFIHKIFTTKEKEGSGSSDFSALEVFAQIGAQKRHILWNKWSRRSRLHCAVAAQDPVGLGLPLEDDVVLIVGHFRDSSEQRIRFPSSDDCVCGKENLGRCFWKKKSLIFSRLGMTHFQWEVISIIHFF
ncbi:unnamed protein product [Malus baccata var. baccata]